MTTSHSSHQRESADGVSAADGNAQLDGAGDSTIDGRHRKRARNVENVRRAIIELLAEGVTPTLALAARRAGVTTRSVYRYFGDIDNAVAEAVSAQRALIWQVFRSEPIISERSPFAERAALLALRRLRLQELVAPIGGHDAVEGLGVMLDEEVAATFAHDLADRAAADRSEMLALLCGVFRVGAVAEIFNSFGGDPGLTVRGMCRLAAALLSERPSSLDPD